MLEPTSEGPRSHFAGTQSTDAHGRVLCATPPRRSPGAPGSGRHARPSEVPLSHLDLGREGPHPPAAEGGEECADDRNVQRLPDARHSVVSGTGLQRWAHLGVSRPGWGRGCTGTGVGERQEEVQGAPAWGVGVRVCVRACCLKEERCCSQTLGDLCAGHALISMDAGTPTETCSPRLGRGGRQARAPTRV